MSPAQRGATVAMLMAAGCLVGAASTVAQSLPLALVAIGCVLLAVVVMVV